MDNEVQKNKSLLVELMNGPIGVVSANALAPVGRIPATAEEEQEQSVTKKAQAYNIFTSMLNTPNSDRQQIIDAIIRYTGATHHTAVSYYERFAKEAGITGPGGEEDQPDMMATDSDVPTQGGQEQQGQGFQDFVGQTSKEEMPEQPQQELEHTFPDDPNKQGIIRAVEKAHLVYKRQTPEGTFEEMWIYNIGEDMKDELTIRRNILAGTDIPAQKTKSPDGTQAYTLWTCGNAQVMCIQGLSN